MRTNKLLTSKYIVFMCIKKRRGRRKKNQKTKQKNNKTASKICSPQVSSLYYVTVLSSAQLKENDY